MKKIKVPNVVLVEWVDAVAETEPWPSNEDVKELTPETVWAVGWLIKKDKEQIKLAKMWNENGWGGVWTIPNGWIRNYVVLEKGSDMGKIVYGKAHCRPFKRSK